MQPAGWLQYSGAGMMVPTEGMAGTAGGSTSSRSGMVSGMNGGTMTPSSDMPFSRVGIGDPIGRIDVALSRADAEHAVVGLVGVGKAPLANVNRGFGTGEWMSAPALSSGIGDLLESGSTVFATAAAGLTRTAPAISTGIGWRVPLSKTR